MKQQSLTFRNKISQSSSGISLNNSQTHERPETDFEWRAEADGIPVPRPLLHDNLLLVYS